MSQKLSNELESPYLSRPQRHRAIPCLNPSVTPFDLPRSWRGGSRSRNQESQRQELVRWPRPMAWLFSACDVQDRSLARSGSLEPLPDAQRTSQSYCCTAYLAERRGGGRHRSQKTAAVAEDSRVSDRLQASAPAMACCRTTHCSNSPMMRWSINSYKKIEPHPLDAESEGCSRAGDGLDMGAPPGCE